MIQNENLKYFILQLRNKLYQCEWSLITWRNICKTSKYPNARNENPRLYVLNDPESPSPPWCLALKGSLRRTYLCSETFTSFARLPSYKIMRSASQALMMNILSPSLVRKENRSARVWCSKSLQIASGLALFDHHREETGKCNLFMLWRLAPKSHDCRCLI